MTLVNGNAYAQVFTNTHNFVAVYPMREKQMAGKALVEFTSNIGIPEWLSSDYSKEQTGPETTFVWTAKKLHIDLKVSEPH